MAGVEGLDCNTPRGREAVALAREVAQYVATAWGAGFAMTPDDRESAIDVLFARDHRLAAVAEVKVRPTLTLETLRLWGSYLITHRKIVEGADMAARLCVPYFVIVGLPVDWRILWWQITDSAGGWLFSPEVRETPTQATCNGGTALRPNAFLPLERMTTIDWR